MAAVTTQGYVADTLPEIVSWLTGLFEGVYGTDISTSPDSPDGQLIGILAQAFADYEELGAAVYRQLDPAVASGRWLDQRAAYVGLSRRVGVSSILEAVQVTGPVGFPVPNGTVCTDNTGVSWVSQRDATIGSTGSTYVNFISEELGSFNLAIGSDIKPKVEMSGVLFKSTREPIPGSVRETDATLRNRMLARKLMINDNVVVRIKTEVGKNAGVISVAAYENPTSAVDANGSPPHSIWVIVDGGLDEDVAKSILATKTGGTPLRGAEEVIITDKSGAKRFVYFDRFIPIPLKATLTIAKTEGTEAIDAESIKRALMSYTPAAGEDVYYSRCFSVINTVPGFWVKDFKISKVGGVLASTNIVIGPQETGRFTDVTVVVE